MNDTPTHRLPADWEPPMPSEAELLAVLSESEAGLFMPGEVVRRDLRDSISRLEARAAGHTAKTAMLR